MNYTKEQLIDALMNWHVHWLTRRGAFWSADARGQFISANEIDALVHEWEYLCHDDYDPDDDTPEEYRLKLECYSLDELIEETSTNEYYTLDEFMENWN